MNSSMRKADEKEREKTLVKFMNMVADANPKYRTTPNAMHFIRQDRKGGMIPINMPITEANMRASGALDPKPKL